MTTDQHSILYLSTTIPYVNAAPHVGFALELVQADALARYLRLTGREVFTSSGTDDHSLKNLRSASAAGEPIRGFLDRHTREFESLAQLLGVHFDAFVSTSRDPNHARSVQALLSACAANGDLYQRRYRGLYCVGCEQFYRPEELPQDLCPEHGEPLETIEEDNWFFRLSRYRAELERAIETDRIRVLPTERKNEVLSFIQRGLQDFSVSRSAERAHGFGLPLPGDSSQVVYVWVDALCNYLTAGAQRPRLLWRQAARRTHVLGKGVLRFHAVYWPALLASAGLPWPDELRVHGYLTVDGKKIGKSAGNGIDPRALIERFGKDALRYYLLKHTPAFKDADFSCERLVSAHDSELADELGNLALRTLTLYARIPTPIPARALEIGEAEAPLEECARGLAAQLEIAYSSHDFSSAGTLVWQLVRATNRYIDRNQPWRLLRSGTREDLAQAARVLSISVAALRVLSGALDPLVPDLAGALARATGAERSSRALLDTSLLGHLSAPVPKQNPTPLVPRLRERPARAPRRVE
ncbi:MAG TPA: methionine--tRNA ligase [Polyangiaceae bacterium]|nr:methionine--tRNA ligase [Polyangiaceae bacterium]